MFQRYFKGIEERPRRAGRLSPGGKPGRPAVTLCGIMYIASSRNGKENSGRYRRGNLRAIRRQPQLQKNRKSRGKSVNVRIW